MSVNPQFCHPPRLQLAQLPTPLQPLERLSAASPGPKIWVKRDDLTGSVLSGNKIRKLEYSLARATQQGCDTVITCGGLQSNHCRATALLCAQLGLRCHLVLRGEAPSLADGNYLLDQLAGAKISCFPAKQYQAKLDEILQRFAELYAKHGRKAAIIPTGASDATGVWGYFNAAKELAADCRRAGIQPRHILCATGSGGTQAGLTAGAFYFLDLAQVWGVNVCDDAQWFLDKVAADLAGWQQRYDLDCNVGAYRPKVIDGYVGPGYAKADPEIFACIAELARTEGLVLDPVYTGKAFYGLLQERAKGRFGDDGDIVFVHTGGVFGLFPQRAEFAFLNQ